MTSTTAVRSGRDIPAENVSRANGVTRQVLTSPGAGAGFHMRRFVMEPGGGMPRHTNSVEHQQYVLRGRAAVVVGTRVHHVQAGDVVHIPAGVPHAYRAAEDEPFEFLCVVPDGDDRVELLE